MQEKHAAHAPNPTPTRTSKELRNERLSRALRDNLRRRKAAETSPNEAADES